MKNLLGLIIAMLVFVACHNTGTMKYKAKFTTAAPEETLKSEEYYSCFGDYVTSITPFHFSSKINMLVFQDTYSQANPDCHMISFVDGHDNMPGYEIATYADFSANQEVEITPILYSTDMRDGVFEQKEVDFKFLTFTPYYLNHKFELPIEYLDVLKNNNFIFSNENYSYDSVTQKITIETMRHFSYGAIHQNADAMPTGFSVVFGNTDSSYIYRELNPNLTEEQKFPFWEQPGNLIRSNKFTSLKIRMPDSGETNTMYSTISFNTTNLIQVYAGKDNIAYTADDVFVYAPRFWERIQVSLETR